MRRIASLLFFLASATAWAHDPSFTALWFQPLPTLVTGGHIFSFGGTKGIVPGLDVTAELTAFQNRDDTCTSHPGCRDRLDGWIATAGVAWTKAFHTNPGGEIASFIGPKVLWATSLETGTPGGPKGPPTEPTELPFVPGRATEIGVGVDAGIEIHGAGGVFFAIAIGMHVSRVFNYGDYATTGESYSSGSAVPTGTVRLLFNRSSGTRRDGVELGFNLNLLRIGINFDLFPGAGRPSPASMNSPL